MSTSLKRRFWTFAIRPLIDLALLPITLRRRMTFVSATMMVFCIASLNVIWQFPFSGLLSACLTILVVGAIGNSWFRPSLTIHAEMPDRVAAGSDFPVHWVVQNVRHLPAIHLRLGQIGGPTTRHRVQDLIGEVSFIGGGESTLLRDTICLDRRGRHHPPAVQVMSAFPLSIWRTLDRVDAVGSVVVTPSVVDEQSPEIITRMLRRAERFVGGRAADPDESFATTRPYEVGEVVRQWDFRAWSRTGSPMVRVTPRGGGGTVHLIVDPVGGSNQLPVMRRIVRGETPPDQDVEWMLRIAATLISQSSAGISQTRGTDDVQIRLWITGDQPEIERTITTTKRSNPLNARDRSGAHVFRDGLDPAVALALVEPIVTSDRSGPSRPDGLIDYVADSQLMEGDLPPMRLDGDVLILTTRRNLGGIRRQYPRAEIVSANVDAAPRRPPHRSSNRKHRSPNEISGAIA